MNGGGRDGGGGGGAPSLVWKKGTDNGRMLPKKDGGWYFEKLEVNYCHHTNSAGVQQCMRKDGRVALLTADKGTFTSRFVSRRSRRKEETEEEYMTMKKEADAKRTRLLFCPELVDIVLHTTWTNEQKLEKLYEFAEKNYPEDFYTNIYEKQALSYGTEFEYRDAEPGESAETISKFDRYIPADDLSDKPMIHHMVFSLRVHWLTPGIRFKVMEDSGYGHEYLVTDEDFDTA